MSRSTASYRPIPTSSSAVSLDELDNPSEGIPLRSVGDDEKADDSDSLQDSEEDLLDEEQDMRGVDERTRKAWETVKEAVPLDDDPSLPCLTFRTFSLGCILCTIGSAISQLFYFKSNAPSFSAFFIILISYIIGKWMAKILPTRIIKISLGPLGIFRFSLNPGPFNKKEHLLIGVIASSGSSSAYAGDIIAIQSLYYHRELPFFGGLLLLLTSQLIGFGLAGLLERLLVKPTAMVWPSSLVVVTLYETLHGNESKSAGMANLTGDRMRFFTLCFIGIFIWQFVPAVIMPTLSSIALICIVSPVKTSLIRILGSGYEGFGLLDFSLDWTVIGAAGSLYTPLFAQLCYFGGFAFNLWLIQPIIYFFSIWEAQRFTRPISAALYNSNFEPFSVSSVTIPETLQLNETAWLEAKPLILTPSFAVSYGISFAILTSAIASVALWNWRDISETMQGRTQWKDPHVKMLERNYESVPGKWYGILGGSMVLAASFLVLRYNLQLPLWGLYLSLCIALFFLVPCGIIAAITNQTIGLNVITEFVCGFILPGRPIGNVTFKVYGYMTMGQCLDLVSDLKLALYMKIPPRAMFLCQTLGTGLGSIVNYILIKGVIESKREYLDGTRIDPTGQWTGRSAGIFYSASVIWGLIGPARFFAGQYQVLYYGFPIGLALPVIPYLLHKRYPDIGFDNISVPVFLHGMIAPPQIPANVILPGLITSFASQWWARTRRKEWFDKYNYVLSAALDAGTSVNALVIYIFGIGEFWTWWGNSDVDSEHCLPSS
ncbi:OPT superfamily oligopeptide transporter [Atractiella rhizophila]|nr:OPT superfamily oligopeptide transporter [Atractiella rhizophila]